MDKKKNVKDEQLEKISGGFDDYNYCEWSPIELHEWEDYEVSPNVKGRRCKWCQIKLY